MLHKGASSKAKVTQTKSQRLGLPTRGKKLVVLVGTKKALGTAVQRHDTSRRYTDLRRRLVKDADC